MKLLVVDDVGYAAQSLVSLLHLEQFEGDLVATASNGLEALEILKNNHIDVIISDIKMPKMNGIQLAKEVHQNYKETSMIFLSAYGEFSYAQEALQYNVKDYILKPITREKLLRLENLLVTINKEQTLKKYNYVATWNGQLKEKIMDALAASDRMFFDMFFNSDYFLSSMKGSLCIPTGTQLITYLYHYLEKIEFNKEVVRSTLEANLANFYDLPSHQEQITFILTKYYDLLTANEHPQESNLHTFADKIKLYVDEHYTCPDCTISYLADKMQVSLSYLSTVFKQITGVNLSAYITQKRLEQAKYLLSNYGYSITSIANRCGYDDSRYFAKLFKKKFNMTPSEYRTLYTKPSVFK